MDCEQQKSSFIMLPYIGASDVIPGSAHWTECTSVHSSSSFVAKKQFSGLKENVQNEVSVLCVCVSPVLPICVVPGHRGPLHSILCLFLSGLVLASFTDSCQLFVRSLLSLIQARCGWSVVFIAVKFIPRDCSFLYVIECHLPFCLCHWCVPVQQRNVHSLLICCPPAKEAQRRISWKA